VAAALDFDRAEVRMRAVLLMLGAALVSPNVYLPAGLPAIRLEQVLLLVFAVPFARYVAGHPEARRLGLVDLAFLAFTVAISLSVALAPVIAPTVGRSWHDIFALVRPFEYWLLYRIALTCVPSERLARATLVVVFTASIAAGIFALLQFLGPDSFNEAVTSIWATSHNLDGVIRSRRVVGTADNANVFAMMASLFSLAAFWTLLLRPPGSRRQMGTAVVAMGAGILGLVLPLSRGATIAVLVGLVFGGAVVLSSRRSTRWRAVVPLVAVFVVLSATLPVLVPSPTPTQTAAERFNISDLGSDPSVVMRVQRLKLLISSSGETAATAGLCTGTSVAAGTAGHELAPVPTPATTSGPPSQKLVDARVRDVQRKQDIAATSAALNRFYCANGGWPASDLASALAAAGLPTIPKDPDTGKAYELIIEPNGYAVSATLEDPGDPDGPIYMATNEPNLVANSSFETGASTPDGWQTDDATAIVLTTTKPKFGSQAAEVRLPPDGFLSQYVVYTLDASTDYSASIWMRSATTTAQNVRFYLTAILADGTRITPAAFVTPTLPADGSWVRATLPFRTPEKGLVYTTELVVQPWPTSGRAQVAVDGATFSATKVAPSFVLTRDVETSNLKSTMPSWLDSPVVGLGPLNVIAIGGDPGEYALILVRFGALGLIAFLALFAATAWLLLAGWRRTAGAQAIVALTGLTATAAGAVFAATTSTYSNYQLMAIYWLLVGLILAFGRNADGTAIRLPRSIRRPDGASAGG
jgi:hypothetical protein